MKKLPATFSSPHAVPTRLHRAFRTPNEGRSFKRDILPARAANRPLLERQSATKEPEGGLESTMSSLDLLLDTPATDEILSGKATKREGQEEQNVVRPDTASQSSAAQTSAAQNMASHNTAAQNTPAQASTPEEVSRKEDDMSWQNFVGAMLAFARYWVKYDSRKWIRDKVKPTSIIEEDANLPRTEPALAYMVLLANLVVYGIGLSRLAEGSDGPMDYFLSLAEVNEAVEAGEYYRIVSANFLHDSFVHLGVSSYALLTIAPEAEAVLGSFAFITTYVLGGAAGTSVCFLLTDTLTVGPSSGIFALIGAMGAFLYKNHKAPKTSDGLFYTAGLLAFNLFLGQDRTSAVDNLGHLGGMLCGIYLGILLSPTLVNRSSGASSGSESPMAGSGQGSSATLPSPQDVAQPNSPVSQQNAGQQAGQDVRVIKPNPLQSFVAVGCVATTLACSVALAVMERTGNLPPPKWPF